MTGGRVGVAAAVIGFAVSACGGGGSVSAPPERPTASADAGASVNLPEDCVAEIRAFLVAVEPMVSDMDFSDPTDEDLELLAPASDAFDPDVCPDVSVAEARDAWLAIAAESAPGAAPYVEYIYEE